MKPTHTHAPETDGKYTNNRPTRSWFINNITRIDEKESDEKVITTPSEQERDVPDVSHHVIVDLILHPLYLYGMLATGRSYARHAHTARRGDPKKVGLGMTLRPDLVF
jgi:hypothetical protein